MRIAFVDSRDKTRLFEAVAARLQEHEIYWLIQNHAFSPRTDKNVCLLPYPTSADVPSLPEEAGEVLARVSASDRVGLIFHRSTTHYNWYYKRTVQWFDENNPDLVLGEAGSFHSHMTALIAEKRGIPFLNPISSRYPSGRFAFYRSDRLVSVAGSEEVWSDTELEEAVQGIVRGERRPDYMSARRSRKDALAIRLAQTREWLKGDHFTAQHPLLFASVKRSSRLNRQRWEQISEVPNGHADFRVLYPLQMQPEMNLDVWGYRYRDQVSLIRDLAAQVGREGGELWVKPNPKSSYELSAQLLSEVVHHPAVHAISHNAQMREIIDLFDLVVTVSGTVAIERLLARQPVLVLLDDFARWIGAPVASELGIGAHNIDRSNLARLTAAQLEGGVPTEVLQRLVATSYRGVISEPTYTPHVLDSRNVEFVADAIRDLVAGMPLRA